MGRSNGKVENTNSKLELMLCPEPDEFFKKAIRITYDYLVETVPLASTKKDLLLMQSMQGRAMNGWWALGVAETYGRGKNYFYPNTTIEDVIEALDLDVPTIQHERQRIIDSIADYFFEALRRLKDINSGISTEDQNGVMLVDHNKQPLGGIKFFEGTIITDPTNILIGAYLGSCLDSAEWRTRTEKEYNITMHKGISMAANINSMNGHTLRGLARRESGSTLTIEQLIEQHVVSLKHLEKYTDGYRSAFIEIQSGYGVSDDAAFITVALNFGLEAAFGFLLMDAIDTWDKSTPYIYLGGQDERIGVKIKENYEKIYGLGSFPCTDDKVIDMIYLSSINKENKDAFPSCSQRRFVQYDKGLYPVLSHVAFVNHLKHGTPLPPSIKIAFQQVMTRDFYSAFSQRYQELAKDGRVKQYQFPILNGVK